MSSLSVTLTGTNAAALVCDFFPPLELTNGEWYVGLLDFTTYNSIPNVIEGKNNVFPVLRDGTTVSYTHLDVYKRQALRWDKKMGKTRKIVEEVKTYPGL